MNMNTIACSVPGMITMTERGCLKRQGLITQKNVRYDDHEILGLERCYRCKPGAALRKKRGLEPLPAPKPKRYKIQIREDIIGAIKRFQKKTGWTQKQIAQHCGCSPSTIAEVKRGAVTMRKRPIQLSKFESLLDVKV